MRSSVSCGTSSDYEMAVWGGGVLVPKPSLRLQVVRSLGLDTEHQSPLALGGGGALEGPCQGRCRVGMLSPGRKNCKPLNLRVEAQSPKV